MIMTDHRVVSQDALKFTMAWVRHHDKYDDGELVDLEAKETQK